MSELDRLRAEIDAIDAALVEGYERRRELTCRVGEYKKSTGMAVTDPKREGEVLTARLALLRDRSLETDLTHLFELIMSQSRRQQRALTLRPDQDKQFLAYERALDAVRAPIDHPTVAYQGQPGAYGEEGAALFFGSGADYIHVERFEQVFEALLDGRADYGVVPIENSSTGGINAVYDLLGRHGCYIVGEQSVHVNHCLMAPRGAKLEDISEVYSHEQGFFQSEPFLKDYPHWRCIPRLNTAASAKFVSEQGDRRKAAIASPRAASLYGLEILAEQINFNSRNDTRFVVVSQTMELRQGCDKISALFTLEHHSGSLHRILSVFAVNGLNLLKIESRPIEGENWNYRFFIDFSGKIDTWGMRDVVRELIESSGSFQILGNYKANVGEAL